MSFHLEHIVEKFDLPQKLLHTRPYGSGHINDTFLASFDPACCAGIPKEYIIQRVNHAVFKDPIGLGENVDRVTQHLRAKIEAEGCDDLHRRVLILIPTRDGERCHRDGEGNYWRAMNFIGRARTFDTVRRPQQAFEVARAFGRFQQLLLDLPGPRLNDTIPRFHDARSRFEAFERAVEVDEVGRARDAQEEIEFAKRQGEMVGVLAELQARGAIPERITHNDTKINNVPLDDVTGEALCVLDLDTVMPGLVHYDFGDMVRTMTCLSPEDETELSKVHLEPDYFDALTRGYLTGAGNFLSGEELELLSFSGKLMTFVIGLRFLTDFLQDDVYFKIKYPTHNLDRTRMQFALVRSIAEQETDLARRVSAIHRELMI